MTCATMVALDPDTAVTVDECGPFFLAIRWGKHRETGLTLTPSQAQAICGGIRRVLSSHPTPQMTIAALDGIGRTM